MADPEEEKQLVRPSCILFSNKQQTAVLVDIPRSIEEAQAIPGRTPGRRIRCELAVSVPYPTPEPKDAEARQMALPPSQLLAELMTEAAVSNALVELREHYTGPFCLDRIVAPSPQQGTGEDTECDRGPELFIPKQSKYLNGSIRDFKEAFVETAPAFHLIVLDPPWPSRSARRKKGGYSTVKDLEETRQLLLSIPVSSHLASDGLVAIWVTNKHSLIELMTGPSGIFHAWGLEMVTEWTWLKITSSGEPVFDVCSSWRKPWERLLLAKRRGSCPEMQLQRKVILAVPDIHSRKPNLRALFHEIMPQGYQALELFARNLTAGWWSWGDEVLKYQAVEHWVAADDDACQGSTAASSQ